MFSTAVVPVVSFGLAFAVFIPTELFVPDTLMLFNRHPLFHLVSSFVCLGLILV